MVRTFDKICKVDYDNILACVLIKFSLFNIYLYRINTKIDI